MKNEQLNLAQEFRVGSFQKTRHLLSGAKRSFDQKFIEFIEEVNGQPVRKKRFYVPQRHG